MRYFLREIESVRRGEPSIFRDPSPAGDDALLALRPGVQFHMFCSHTPCGDASIFPRDTVADNPGKRPTNGTENREDNDDSERCHDHDGPPDAKRTRLDRQVTGDIHRTGAKCLDAETRRDAKLPGLDYHVVTAVRTKPGRGDPTLSVSCSDKLLRWNLVGVQVSRSAHKRYA